MKKGDKEPLTQPVTQVLSRASSNYESQKLRRIQSVA